MTDLPYTYKGDAVLLNWVENDKGRSVTFLLGNDETHHPFKGLPRGPDNGARFQIVVVRVGPDEQPIGPQTPAALPGPGPQVDAANTEDKPRRPFESLPRSQQAGIRCNDVEFQEFLIDTRFGLWAKTFADTDQGRAANVVKAECGVTTRAKLDAFPGAASKWDLMLSRFDAWQTTRKYEGLRR